MATVSESCKSTKARNEDGGDPTVKFTVASLKALAASVRDARAGGGRTLPSALRRRQPYLWAMIRDVGADPRCAAAAAFCTGFCLLALEHADSVVGLPIPVFLRPVLWGTICPIARQDSADVGRRACGYPSRIRQHVLAQEAFDEDDTAWLSSTLSGFLAVIEQSTCGTTKRPNHGLNPTVAPRRRGSTSG